MSENVAPDAPAQIELLGKHLDRYQAIISRLAGNSVQVKTWCFTVAAALSAIAVDQREPAVFVIGAALVCAFFYLDSYYLALEKHFRDASTRLATRFANGEPVPLTELVVVAPPHDRIKPSRILMCGASSQTASIYFVVIVGLAVGALAVPT